VYCHQRRIFIFGALGYFKLGTLLEGLRRLMSHKLALHVLVTFTEQVVPIWKHIFFVLNSLDMRNKNSHSETLTKKSAVTLSENTPITYLLSSLRNCNVCKCQDLALSIVSVLLYDT